MPRPSIPIYPGEEVLRRLYMDEQKSLAEIAGIYSVTKGSVSKWLKKASISARSARESTMLSGKYGVQSDAHRERLREGAAKARTKITADSREKQRQSMLGRTPPNKGVPWSAETRAKHEVIRATEEYRENLSASLRGEKSLNWKGGVKSELARRLDTAEWRRTRKLVYERDDWTCVDCGTKCLNTSDSKSQPKRKIQAHHIVGRRDGGSDDLSNLVTLCMSCHHRRERLST